MIEKQVSENYKDLRTNHAEATIVVQIFPQDLRIYDRLIVGLMLWYLLFIARFCVLIHFFSILWKFFVNWKLQHRFSELSHRFR